MTESKIKKRDSRPIKIDLINRDNNVRTEEQYKNLEELQQSITRIGLIQPIIVTKADGRFDLLAGQRRVLAFEQLGEKEIPAIIVDDLDQISRKILSLTENIHRRALPYGDTVRVCDELFNIYTGTTSQRIDKMAKEIGISISTITKYLSYRLVPKKVRDMVDEGKITATQAFKITQAFWPNTEKITKIAELTAQTPKQTWERALTIGKKKPKATPEEIMKEALTLPETYKVSLELDQDSFKVLNEEAEKRTKALQREVSIEEVINQLIENFISKGG